MIKANDSIFSYEHAGYYYNLNGNRWSVFPVEELEAEVSKAHSMWINAIHFSLYHEDKALDAKDNLARKHHFMMAKYWDSRLHDYEHRYAVAWDYLRKLLELFEVSSCSVRRNKFNREVEGEAIFERLY